MTTGRSETAAADVAGADVAGADVVAAAVTTVDAAVVDVAAVDVVTFDVAVVGAGPAGLAAAVAAADQGARVALIDAEPGAGGQFWRHPAPEGSSDSDGLRDADVAHLHHDLGTFRRLRDRWRAHVATSRCEHLARCEVWALDTASAQSDGARVTLHVTGDGVPAASGELRARSLVLATGAYDLQLPFDGWDLPGVMAAGGVQSLLKGHGVLAGRRVAVAGTGPFLLSVASGLARSGASVVGVFEVAAARSWAGLAMAGAAQPAKAREAAGYAWDLGRYRIPLRTGQAVIRAHPNDRGDLGSVTVAPVDRNGDADESRSHVIDVDVLAVGWGFVPRLELAVALGCRTEPGAGGLSVAVADAAQRSSVPGVFLAGEICGVGGAALALAEGEIAGAVAAAEARGSMTAERRAALARGLSGAVRRRKWLRGFAAALGRSFPVPSGWGSRLGPETVVCRCEEVTAAEILATARRHGASDSRTVKLLARPGMGWCQGRICGYATEELVAGAAGVVARHRSAGIPVAAPLPLGELARHRAMSAG